MSQEDDDKKVQKPDVSKTGKPCPFVVSPWDECFVVGINSLSTEKAIYYCGWNCDKCEIYLRRIQREPP